VQDWHEVDCEACLVHHFLAQRRQTRMRKGTTPLFEEESMKLPLAIRDILVRFAARYPLPACAGCSGETRENAVRQWTYMFVEQVCFERPPSEGWGTKRAGPNRPISADTVTQRRLDSELAEALVSWDLVVAAGDENQHINLDPDSIVTTGQVFVEVPGVDHLGSTPTPPPPPPEGETIATVLHRLDGIEAQLVRLQTAVDAHERDQVARDRYLQQMLTGILEALRQAGDRSYEAEARAWFGTMRFTLKPKTS